MEGKLNNVFGYLTFDLDINILYRTERADMLFLVSFILIFDLILNKLTASFERFNELNRQPTTEGKGEGLLSTQRLPSHIQTLA